MAEDKQMDTIQEELKLLKGEVKQSLASVRDYLLNMELPSTEFSTILAALGGDGQQKVTIDGSLANAIGNKAAEALAGESQDAIPADEVTEESDEDEEETVPEDEDLLDMENPAVEESGVVPDESPVSEEEEISPEDSMFGTDETELSPEDAEISPEDAIEEETYGDDGEFIEPEEELVEQGDTTAPEPEMSEEEAAEETAEAAEEEEEQPVDYATTEVSSAIPKVNMLANLINWISKAKQEIGYDQLPAFLEVYGISGHLSPELKEVILQLAEISAERPEVINNAEVWSQSMLSLHGILTGGDAPLNPVIPTWNEAESTEEEIIEVDKAKEATPKLKLVFPNGDGKSKEFCIDLNLEENNDDSPQKRKN
jgi:hypothetical protein